METVAIAEAFASVAEVEERFRLCRNIAADFFSEWTQALPELTDSERRTLDSLKETYLYQSDGYILTESTVNLLLISPLLQLAGFFYPPFKIRSELTVAITVEEEERIDRGRIDTLVIRSRFWLLLVESKQTRFNFQAAVPQALAYMMGAPEPQRAVYGLVTNGDGFRFLKLLRTPESQYNLSEDFSLFSYRRNELHDVLRILKRIGGLIAEGGV
ncbi:type I restriction endonuclease subunit R [Gloeobacter morelensis]|uniref:type I restriction endonuclease subunit R n=1 Tax=Gloeobacter morelensis TaxID=2907343 RepID=UPI001E2EEF88|nr:type I restriction endonuclease subunit R [Gloeobacter morelensis]